MTRQQWLDQFDKMEALGAVVADSDRDAPLNLLTDNFSPEKGAANDAAKESGIKGSSASSTFAPQAADLRCCGR
jgi:hypothetical protein